MYWYRYQPYTQPDMSSAGLQSVCPSARTHPIFFPRKTYSQRIRDNGKGRGEKVLRLLRKCSAEKGHKGETRNEQHFCTQAKRRTRESGIKMSVYKSHAVVERRKRSTRKGSVEDTEI
jgi:hypothetical protein